MKLKSSEPFWLVKNGLLHTYPSLREDMETEVLIIGGGITGSLIAHQCMQEGYQTMVVDKREIASGSTSATTSMLQYEIDVPLYQLIDKIGQEGAVSSYQACYHAIDQLGQIAREVRSDSGFTKKDSLYFSAFKKDNAWLKKEFETRKKYGFPVEWLSAGDIQDSYHIQHTHGGILSKQGGSIDAFRLTHDILAHNHKKGMPVYDKTAISKVIYHPNKPKAITGYGNIIRAKTIIYCNGYESTEIIKDKFVNLLSTYAIVGERFQEHQNYFKDLLVWNTASPYIYMRLTDDNRLLIGGEDEPFKDTAERDSLLGLKQLKLEKQLNKILPALDYRTDFTWAGTFGETKDGLPYIGAHPNFPSTYFVLGFGGNGITFSVIGMEMVAAFLKKKKHPLAKYYRFRR
ncbi:NAD(P)/FAD-dependent oxidoreductase [Arachidicoccus terrestris]|uniref:NAD(P)/FAD-dependent oxidoreductase n=1 Tax=Arachidicoccus terrestris TaxID=2875539 RepID=UPI001CC6EFD1|nr:FAD-binding oxidoreductase [Arachidicoccus terrestris]UAY56053.1 FAD-binding oxidoreductase [Arachidicoccus terrestris]